MAVRQHRVSENYSSERRAADVKKRIAQSLNARRIPRSWKHSVLPARVSFELTQL